MVTDVYRDTRHLGDGRGGSPAADDADPATMHRPDQ
jgi:hypothetical protein